MATTSYKQSNFNSGEITPRLKGRSDIDKFPSSLQKCENAIVLPQGGIFKRSGFRFIEEVEDSTKITELIRFEFSEDEAYTLEFGDENLRVFTDDGQVAVPDANTILLVHADGLDASTTFTDVSDSAHTLTVNGNAQVNTTGPKFGTGAALFDGSGDAIRIPDDTDWDFGSGEWCIEMFVKFTGHSECHTLFVHRSAALPRTRYMWIWADTVSGQGLPFIVGSVHLHIVENGTNHIKTHSTFSSSVQLNTWYHVAVQRDSSGDTKVFIDGLSSQTATDSYTIPSTLDDVVTLGRATPNAVDVSSNAHILTLNGPTSGLVTTQQYFGTSSLQWNTATDEITIPDHANWDIHTSSNWNFQCFIKFDSHSGTETILAHYQDAANYWRLDHIHGTGWRFQTVVGGVPVFTMVAGGEISDTNWHHIALIRTGTDDYGIYVDGTQVIYGTYNLGATFTGLLHIGRFGSVSDTFDGYMDMVRIHASVNALGATPNVGLTSTVTVPTAPIIWGASALPDLHIIGDLGDFAGEIDEIRISNTTRFVDDPFIVQIVAYPGGGVSQSGGDPYEIVSPYLSTDVADIRFIQSADTLYLFHTRYQPRKLTRVADDNWTFTTIQFNEPPWSPTNTTATTLTPSATTGSITLTASASYFSTDHEGAYFRLHSGFVQVDVGGFVSTTVVNATVVTTLSATSATATWELSAWNGVTGWPTAGAFHEDRLVLVGAGGFPMTVFLSGTSDYENFGLVSAPVVDTDPLSTTIWSEHQNSLVWIKSGKRLYLGSNGAEFWMTGATVDLPITPTSILVRKETNIGSEPITPVSIGEIIIFVQKGGKRLREWSFDDAQDGFLGADISILAEHITKTTTIKKIAYAQDPHSIVWILMNDGALWAMTYLREHQVVGFHNHTTSGTFESISVIPGADDDELHVIANRTVNGSTVRYVEKLEEQFFGKAIADAFFVDSGLSGTVATPTAIWKGLDHLEGETVQVLADGVKLDDEVVSGGQIDLGSTTATTVHAGLAYNMDVETQTPNLSFSPGGNTGDKRQRIIRNTYLLHETSQMKYGPDAANLIEIPFTDGELFTGDKTYEFNGDYEWYPSTYIRNDEPLPFTLLALISKLDIENT